MKVKQLFQKASLFLAMSVCVMTTQAQVHPLHFSAQQNTEGPGIATTNTILVDFESGRGATINSSNGWGVQSANRGEIVSLAIATRANGDPVRFGEQALRVNFDLTNAQSAQTLGIYFNPQGSDPIFRIPAGTGDRRFGMWIYVTPEFQQANFWCRVMFSSAPAGGAILGEQVAGFSQELYSRSMILGWQYYEVVLSSASVNGGRNTNELRPFAAATQSYALFRFMQLSTATNQQPLIRGHFFVDNLRFNIGAEDRARPNITAVTGNGTNLRTTPTFTQAGAITLSFNYNDPASNSSGINAASAVIVINGVIFNAQDAGFTATGSSASITRNFRNGNHTVQVYIEDNFGHIQHETVTFRVNDPNFVGTEISLEPAETAFVGKEFRMDIVTNRAEDVKELDLNFSWPRLASVAPTGALEFAPGVTGNYTYDAANRRLNVKLQNDVEAATGKKTLATIKITVDRNVFLNEILRVTPGLAMATFADGDKESVHFFDEFTREIEQELRFSLVRFVTGAPGEVLVTDLADGLPLAGATVHVGTNRSTTNANGIAQVTVPTGISDVFAEHNGRFSFTLASRALQPHLTRAPEGIRSGTNVCNATEKTIAWLSNPMPLGLPAIMRLAKEADGEAAFVEHRGETRDLNFAASQQILKGSRVRVTGLEPGTWYIYQVGDGEVWSETQKFRTAEKTDKFSFVGFGDYQFTSADQIAMVLAAGNTIAAMETPPFFHLNVADNNDTDDTYGHFAQMTSVYNQRPALRALNLHAAYGNHEYMGYSGNIKFLNAHQFVQPSSHFNHRLIGDGSYYSLYGNNMIVFSLDWENRGGVSQAEMARWIDYVLTHEHPNMDWKFVTLHYPLYPTPSTSGSHAALNWVFNKHNISIVFCGHGHTFRRDVVRTDGTFYHQVGNAGNWTDVSTSAGVVHWQLGGLRPSDGQNQNWVMGHVDGRKIEFVVRGGDNTIRENRSWTLTHENYGYLDIEFGTECDGEMGSKVATVNGVAIESGATVQKGRQIVFTANPKEGFHIKQWTVNGDVVQVPEAYSGNTLTLAFEEDAEVKVEFKATVGFDDIPKAIVQLFPNPFTNEVSITGAANSNLQVLCVLGKVVHTQRIMNETESVQLGQLSNGVYFFRLERNGELQTFNVIKR